jgi:MFS family permease
VSAPSPAPGRTEEIDRRALRSVAVQFFSNGATYATIVPRLPEIREQVGVSIGTLGLVLTIGSLGGLVGTLLTGPVIARVGSRRVMVYGATISLAFLPVTTSPAILAIALFGLLFFDIFIDVAMNVQGSAISARRHTPVMNRLHGLWSLGSVAGGVVTVLTLRAGVSTEVQLTVVAIVLIVTLRFMAPGLLHRDATPELEASAAAVAERPHVGRFGFATLLLAAGGATAMAIEWRLGVVPSRRRPRCVAWSRGVRIPDVHGGDDDRSTRR